MIFTLKKNKKFLEFASVHENIYGTSIEAVEAVADFRKVNVVLFTVLLIVVIIPNDALKVAQGIIIIPDYQMEFHLGAGYIASCLNP